jgi:hypothetical protein
MPAVALVSACLALASGAAPYAQFGGDGMRSKVLQNPIPANLAVVANASLSPCGGGGGGGASAEGKGQSKSSCTFVTQMLMGADERAFFVWDSASGVTAYDAATLKKLFSVPGTASHSCFSLDAGANVLWAQRAGARGAHEMIVTNYSVGRAGAVKLADVTVPVDTWESGSGQQRWAATCFVQAPPSQWPQAASPLYVTQFEGALRIRAGVPSARWPSSHTLAARPPPGCALNTSLSTPLLLKGAAAGAQQQQGFTAIAVYMSCEEAVPTKLVYYTWPWQQDNHTYNPNHHNPHRTVEPPLLDAVWSADVGSIDPVFSDYRFVGAAAGSIVLYQDADAKAIGAISAAGDAAHRPGTTLWTKSTGGSADGVLAAGETTALLWTELNATVAAVDVHTGNPLWSADVRAACGEDPTTAVLQAAAMLGPAGDSALLLAWFRTGANCLVEVRGPGTVVQVLHLGFAILPPNAANVLLARNGTMLVYLADRVLRIEGE